MSIELGEDFLDMMRCLNECNVKYVIVGAFAMAQHGYIRATGDIDVFVAPEKQNSIRVFEALKKFGVPISNLESEYFAKPGVGYQVGLPPLRIDILTAIEGVSYDEAIQTSIETSQNQISYRFLSLDMLIQNKETNPRDKDRQDVIELRKLRDSRKKKK